MRADGGGRRWEQTTGTDGGSPHRSLTAGSEFTATNGKCQNDDELRRRLFPILAVR